MNLNAGDSIKRPNRDLDTSIGSSLDEQIAKTCKTANGIHSDDMSNSDVFTPTKSIPRSPVKKPPAFPMVPEKPSDLTTMQNNPQYNLSTSNSFESLSDATNTGASASTSEPNKKLSTKQKVFIPPFVIVGATDYSIAINIVWKHAKDNYTVKYMSIGTKVQVNNITVYKAINDELITLGIRFFTHDLDELKINKFVISGLPCINVCEIEQSLQQQNVKCLNVQQVLVKQARFESECIYIVSFDANITSLAELSKIKYVNHVSVKWSTHKNIKKGPTQCRNCFMYGHGMRNCHLPKKCSKCGSTDHSLALCDVQDENLSCVNCKGKHEANSADCKHRNDFIAMRQKLSSKRNSTFKKPNNGFTRSKDADKEFPDTLKNSRQVVSNTWSFNNRPASEVRSLIPKQADRAHSAVVSGSTPKSYREAVLFSAEEIIMITKEVFAGLAQCQTKEDQLGVIFQVAVKHIYGSKP